MKFLAVILGALAAALTAKYSRVDVAAVVTEEIPPMNESEPLQAPVDASPVDVIADVVVEAVDTAQNVVSEVVAAFGTPYDDLIKSSAAQYGIDPGVLYRLLMAESHFRPDIISGKTRSRVGALGIAQFMPATAKEELGSVEAALNPSIAIPGAARYLAKLILSTGSVAAGVAAYNWGVGNVKRKGLNRAPDETVAYVQSITGVNLG